MRRPTVAFLLSLAALATPAAQPAVLAPYSPTPMDVVERMLKLAGVGTRDVVYDLARRPDGTLFCAQKLALGPRTSCTTWDAATAAS